MIMIAIVQVSRSTGQGGGLGGDAALAPPQWPCQLHWQAGQLINADKRSIDWVATLALLVAAAISCTNGSVGACAAIGAASSDGTVVIVVAVAAERIARPTRSRASRQCLLRSRHSSLRPSLPLRLCLLLRRCKVAEHLHLSLLGGPVPMHARQQPRRTPHHSPRLQRVLSQVQGRRGSIADTTSRSTCTCRCSGSTRASGSAWSSVAVDHHHSAHAACSPIAAHGHGHVHCNTTTATRA